MENCKAIRTLEKKEIITVITITCPVTKHASCSAQISVRVENIIVLARFGPLHTSAAYCNDDLATWLQSAPNLGYFTGRTPLHSGRDFRAQSLDATARLCLFDDVRSSYGVLKFLIL